MRRPQNTAHRHAGKGLTLSTWCKLCIASTFKSWQPETSGNCPYKHTFFSLASIWWWYTHTQHNRYENILSVFTLSIVRTICRIAALVICVVSLTSCARWEKDVSMSFNGLHHCLVLIWPATNHPAAIWDGYLMLKPQRQQVERNLNYV